MTFKQERLLLEYFSKFELTDLLAFGNILGVEDKEEQPFEDYITEILVKFNQLPRIKRKQLIKLAKDVVGANKDLQKAQESQII